MNTNYDEIELNFSNLLKVLTTFFTSNELAEIQEFIDYGEYGLALDTAIDILIEEDKKVDKISFEIIIKLSNLMGLDQVEISKKIKNHILP